MGVDALMVKPTSVPDPAKLNVAGSRLATWLSLANTARRRRDDVGALRDYHMILEDIYNGRPGAANPAVAGISFARDFVSHGRIDRPSAMAFLAAELG